MDIRIAARHLRKTFGQTVAVNDLSLQVAAGEVYGLVGPDGAGKTTTLRLLCGAMQPDREEVQPFISIAGCDVLHQTDLARARLGYLPQRFSLYEDLTVLENIRFFAEVRGLSAGEWRPRCMQILEFVGLAEFAGRRAGLLSGGMKQKLGLAVALVHQPEVLLLDEPTTGVDPVTRQDFWQLIIRLVNRNDGGTAVLVSTPYMDEAARCHRVGFMRLGRLAAEGTPAQLRLGLQGRVLELAGEPLSLLRQLARGEPDVEDLQMFGDRMHLRVRNGQAQTVISHLQSLIPEEGGHIERLRMVAPVLEDVFMSLSEQPE
jgi:ABC-2 type transport system ATP-binding protein